MCATDLYPDSDSSAVCLAMQTGVILLAGGILQVGFIVENLLSAPVLSGFTQGAAVLIVLSQLKHVFGHPRTGTILR